MTIFNDIINNPMLMIAIGVFALCVIIGFFGDMYLRKQNKIGKIFDDGKNSSKPEEEAPAKTEEVMPSENINTLEEQPSNMVNQPLSSDMMVNQSIDNVMNDFNPVANDPNIFMGVPNNMNQEISEPIVPDLYPPENNIQDITGQPVAFDGQINTDENINNMF